MFLGYLASLFALVARELSINISFQLSWLHSPIWCLFCTRAWATKMSKDTPLPLGLYLLAGTQEWEGGQEAVRGRGRQLGHTHQCSDRKPMVWGSHISRGQPNLNKMLSQKASWKKYTT